VSHDYRSELLESSVKKSGVYIDILWCKLPVGRNLGLILVGIGKINISEETAIEGA